MLKHSHRLAHDFSCIHTAAHKLLSHCVCKFGNLCKISSGTRCNNDEPFRTVDFTTGGQNVGVLKATVSSRPPGSCLTQLRISVLWYRLEEAVCPFQFNRSISLPSLICLKAQRYLPCLYNMGLIKKKLHPHISGLRTKKYGSLSSVLNLSID